MKSKYDLHSITVLMSIYSESEIWLRESIESILDQSFGDFEFIIINDNPQRSLNKNLLNEYSLKDHRIKILNNEQNIGLTKSLNIGIKAANGKYIVRQDADDISLLNRIEDQFNFMESNPEITVSGSYMLNFNERDNGTRIVKFPLTDIEIRNTMFITNPISHPTVIIRTEILKKNSILYNQDIRFAQDHQLWCDLSDIGKFRNIDKVYVKHRVSSGQISINKIDEQTKLSREIRKKQFNKILKGFNIEDLSKMSRKTILQKDKEYGYQGKLITAYYLYKNTFNYLDLIFIILTFDLFKIGKHIIVILRERLGINFLSEIYIKLFTKKN